MNAYAVRLGSGHHRPREIVGFFVVDDQRSLYDLIDECCDVEGCEVMELGPGGIFWDKAVDYVVPLEVSETAPGLPPDAAMTERWFSDLFDEDRWKPITSADLDAAYGH